MPAGRGGDVPLSAVADIKLTQGPNSINRFDRQRQATVAADLVGHAALGDAMKQINALPVMVNLAKHQPPASASSNPAMPRTWPNWARASRA